MRLKTTIFGIVHLIWEYRNRQPCKNYFGETGQLHGYFLTAKSEWKNHGIYLFYFFFLAFCYSIRTMILSSMWEWGWLFRLSASQYQLPLLCKNDICHCQTVTTNVWVHPCQYLFSGYTLNSIHLGNRIKWLSCFTIMFSFQLFNFFLSCNQNLFSAIESCFSHQYSPNFIFYIYWHSVFKGVANSS